MGKSEMVLDFETIELRDGRSSPISAELMEIRQSESVKVVDVDEDWSIRVLRPKETPGGVDRHVPVVRASRVGARWW
jgi:hypothetical protein